MIRVTVIRHNAIFDKHGFTNKGTLGRLTGVGVEMILYTSVGNDKFTLWVQNYEGDNNDLKFNKE